MFWDNISKLVLKMQTARPTVTSWILVYIIHPKDTFFNWLLVLLRNNRSCNCDSAFVTSPVKHFRYSIFKALVVTSVHGCCGPWSPCSNLCMLYCEHVFHSLDRPRNSSFIHSKGCNSVAKETQNVSVIGSAVSRQPISLHTHTHMHMQTHVQRGCLL